MDLISMSYTDQYGILTVLNQRDFILIDAKGNDIWAQVPLSFIPKFEHLEEQKVYTIQNFKVMNAPRVYRPISNRYIIEFSNSTTIEESENCVSIPQFKFSFIKEAEIPLKVDHRVLLTNTIGYVVDYLRPERAAHNLTWKELILRINKEFNVLVLVWGKLMAVMDKIASENENNPFVLIVNSVFVREFNGQNALTTSGATQFYANPLIPQVVEFETRDPEAYGVGAPMYSDPSDISKTSEVTPNELNASITDATNKHKFYMLDCTIKAVRNGWCYTGCQTCAKKVADDVPDYFCCKKVRTETSPRYRIQLEVRDDTNESDFVLLDYLAESILGLTAKKLYEINGNDTENPPILIMNLVDKVLKVLVRVTEYNIRTARNEFTITKIVDAPKAIQSPTSPEHVAHFDKSPPSSNSPKSCVSKLGPTSPKSSTVIEEGCENSKGAAVKYNDEIEDELSDEAPLATIRKRLKRRKYINPDSE
ncbi:Replication protein A 70 kDa DNA-binding subunit B [Linum perenne]